MGGVDNSRVKDRSIDKPEAGRELLAPLEVYLTAGLHIGTHTKTKVMMPFIYKVRPDGLHVFDIYKIDEKIRVAARFIARFEPSKILVTSLRRYGERPVEKFCEIIGAKAIAGRFTPGTLTNPKLSTYCEPDLIIVTDPQADEQACEEAGEVGIPIVSFCHTDSEARYVDLIVPMNNKGRKSLAFAYRLLARQVLRERGEIPPDGDIAFPVEEFEAKAEAPLKQQSLNL